MAKKRKTLSVKIIGLVQKAIAEAGSQRALARAIGAHQPDISDFLNGRRMVPVKKAVIIERLFGIPVWRLRPDLYEGSK